MDRVVLVSRLRECANRLEADGDDLLMLMSAYLATLDLVAEMLIELTSLTRRRLDLIEEHEAVDAVEAILRA